VATAAEGRAAGAERLYELGQLPAGAHDLDPAEGPVPGVVGIGEDRDVLRRQPVAAGQRASGRVVHLQQPAGRVMFQPFPHVPLRGAGPPGQLRRGRRAVHGERPVQPQPLAQIDGEQLQRPDHVMK
jgi:hypothetical protein